MMEVHILEHLQETCNSKRVCNKCGQEKDRIKDFYVSNQRACCKACMPMNQKVIHKCKTCGKERVVTKQNLKNSKGECRECAQKEVTNRPERKAILSSKARAQVLRQGGVPNAKKFTKDHAKEKHYNWKGGITPEVMVIRNSEEVANWRKSVFERDDYTCQNCGERGGKLCAHHIKSFSKFPDLRTELSNGQTLCYPCHRKTHNYGSKSKKEII